MKLNAEPKLTAIADRKYADSLRALGRPDEALTALSREMTKSLDRQNVKRVPSLPPGAIDEHFAELMDLAKSLQAAKSYGRALDVLKSLAAEYSDQELFEILLSQAK